MEIGEDDSKGSSQVKNYKRRNADISKVLYGFDIEEADNFFQQKRKKDEFHQSNSTNSVPESTLYIKPIKICHKSVPEGSPSIYQPKRLLSDVPESIAPSPLFDTWNLTTRACSSPDDILTKRDMKESNNVDDAVIKDTWRFTGIILT